MNHTSGYRCYVDIETTGGGMATQPKGKAFAAQMQQTGANFAPGEAQLYCNGSFHLLSVVVDRVSGMPFEQFLLERVFAPLGMKDTACVASDLDILPGMATLHVARPGPAGGIAWRRGIFMTEEVRGEGGIVSTVDDMLLWLAHLRSPNKVVGSAETWRQMTSTATLNNGQGTVYALGLFCHPYRGVQTVYHHGAVYGGMCQMLTVPEHGLDLIIITNGGMLNHIETSKRMIDAMLPEHLKGDAAPKLASSSPFKHLVGAQYVNDAGMVLGFDEAGDLLAGSMLFSQAAPMFRDEGHQLRVAFEDVAMGPFIYPVAELAAGPDGQAPASFTFTESGMVSRFKRLPARAPSTAKVGIALLGRYRSQDLDAAATIAFEGDALTMRMQGGYGIRHIVLDAASAAVFRMTVRDELLPSTSALVVERKGGAVVGFRFGSARARGLHFERVAD
jgi:hypothetical protein